MTNQENLLSGLIVLLAVYAIYALPLGTALLSIGGAAIVFALTKSKMFAAGVIVIGIMSNSLNGPTVRPTAVAVSVPLPVAPTAPVPVAAPVEGFQARDPVSVHTRLETVKIPAPLAPKVQNITGVLESANILDNSPLMAMDSLAHEGVPGASIPASAKARVLIYPPPEDSVPVSKESIMNGMMSNPYLQTGQDRMAEEVARAEKGTDIYAEDASTLQGVATGAGPAF